MRLHGRRLPERLMRAIGVAALESGRLDVQGAHAQLDGAGLAELAAAHRAGALDATALFGAFGRQREQRDAPAPAGGLEPGRGLAAVDLHRPDVERRLADQMVGEVRGAGGGAREQARMQHSLETGHTASDSLTQKPGSMATLRRSIRTIWPGLRPRSPQRRRRAWRSNLRRRLGSARP